LENKFVMSLRYMVEGKPKAITLGRGNMHRAVALTKHARKVALVLGVPFVDELPLIAVEVAV